MLAYDVQVIHVARIVDRVRLGHSDHRGVLDSRPDPRARCRAPVSQVRSAPRPCWSRAHPPRSRNTPGRGRYVPRHGHHGRTPVVEVLNAPDLHVRGVYVDPVVGKWVFLLEDQRDHDEIAIIESPPGGQDSAGGSGRSARTNVRGSAWWRSRGPPRSAGCPIRSPPRPHHRAVLQVQRGHGAPSERRPPSPRSDHDRSPTSDPVPAAGSGTRSIRVLISVAAPGQRRRGQDAFPSESPWMR
jgi:hypothetical protein